MSNLNLIPFKEAKEKDIHECAEIMARTNPWNVLYFSLEQCHEAITDKDLTTYLVEIENKVAGVMATRPTGMEGEPLLEYICLHEDYRGKGVGTQLLHIFETELFPHADNLYLFVSDINPRAINMYEKNGYVKVGTLPDYNLVGQTEYLYRKYRRPRQERFIPKA
jgi:[ribosomal protein S18]-alanine N-acetyltransferase